VALLEFVCSLGRSPWCRKNFASRRPADELSRKVNFGGTKSRPCFWRSPFRSDPDAAAGALHRVRSGRFRETRREEPPIDHLVPAKIGDERVARLHPDGKSTAHSGRASI
jgi:hypothetical protein